MENVLLLTGGDFKFYCFQLKKPSGDDQNFSIFLVGLRVQCSFPMWMKLQGINITGDNSMADFTAGRGFRRVCDSGMS